MAEVLQIYLAHPVGAPDAAGVEANLRRFSKWLRYLVDLALPEPLLGQISWCAPWVAYVHALGDDAIEYRERGLRDTIEVLERSDALVTIGRETPGVQRELGRAREWELPIARIGVNGHLPPLPGEGRWWEQREHAETIRALRDVVAAVHKRKAAMP